MSAVRLRVCAPAKINLHLEVLGLRGDGYHDVRTILQSIALADTLVLTPRRGPFTVRSRAQAMPRDRENLIWRAAAALWRALGRSGDPSGVAVTIRKVVPAGAGLGGASSDAASALRALRRIWAPDAPDRLLRDVAAAVGSDVPFFLQGGTVVATGRGERTRRLAPVDPCEVVLGVPGFEVSTAAAYRWWDEEAGVGAGRRSAGLEAGAPVRGGALGPGGAGLEAGAPVRGGAPGPGGAGLEAGAPVRGGAVGPGHAGLEAGAPVRGGALGPGRAGLEAGAPVRGGAVGPGRAGLEGGAPVRGGAVGSGGARAMVPRGWRSRLERLWNDLEEPVSNRHPEIGEMVRRLRAAGAVRAGMTGSGSAVFGLFRSATAAERARRAVRRRGWRTMRTRTIDAAGHLRLAAVARTR